MTLAELVTIKTREQALAELLAALEGVGFPATSWHSTSVPYRILVALAGAFALLTTLLVAVAKGGLLEYATGAWLTLLAKSVYQLTRYPATFATRKLRMADRASAGPHNIAANQMWFATDSGKRFTNTAAFIIALDGTAEFDVIAEFSGSAHNVATDDITRLLTPLPGVGYVTGQISYNPAAAVVTHAGTDEESDDLLVQRCSDRWSTLGYGANNDWYRYYVRNAPTYGSDVTRVRVDTDPAGTGTVTVTVAGPSGAIAGASLVGINAYMQAIKSNCVTLILQNATNVTVAPEGDVYAYAAYTGTALASIESSLNALFAATDIGAVVYRSQVVDAIQYDGAEVRNADVTVPAANLVLTTVQVPVRGTLAGLTIHSV